MLATKNLQKTYKKPVSHSNCLPGCKKKSDGIQTIRCCTCMRWYHAACVKEDLKASGIWNCYECRDFPHRRNEFLSEFEAIIGNSNAMFQVNIEFNTIKLKMEQLVGKVSNLHTDLTVIQECNSDLTAQLIDKQRQFQQSIKENAQLKGVASDKTERYIRNRFACR